VSGIDQPAAVTKHTAADRTPTFASLQFRNFRLFFVGQTISQMGNWLTLIAQTLFVLELTDSGIALGVLAACQFGPVLLLGAYGGVMSDRLPRRKLLITAQAAAMLQSFALALLAASGQPSVYAVYAVAAVGGLITAFDNPVRRTFVTDMVPKELVPNAISLNSALMTGARIVGPALAGVLVKTAGFAWTFALDGVSYIAVLVGLFLMRPSELRPQQAVVKAKGQIREGLRYVRATPELLVSFVMMLLVGTFALNYQTVFPLLVTRSLGQSDTAFTILMSFMSVGSVTGALTAARRGSPTVETSVFAAAGFAVFMSALAFSPTFPIALGFAVLTGFFSMTFMTQMMTLAQVRSTPVMLGRVMALQSIVFIGSTPIGGPIVGTIGELISPRVAVLLGGLSAFAAGAYGYKYGRGLRRSAHAAEPAIDVGTAA
jgi:MFS family permease